MGAGFRGRRWGVGFGVGCRRVWRGGAGGRGRALRATYYYFAAWRDDGTDQTVHDLLRWQLRESRKRWADPSLVVLDTQSVHAAVGVPADTTGKDASKKVPGRKRCLAVDVLGLVVEAVALPASAHDNAAGIALLNGVAGQCDTVRKALVDQGFKKSVVDHGKALGIDVEIVKRNPAEKGFVPQAKRWIVERVRREALVDRVEVEDLHQSAVAAVEGDCNARRRRGGDSGLAARRAVGAAAAGTGDADQAAPLGGGRSRLPLR